MLLKSSFTVYVETFMPPIDWLPTTASVSVISSTLDALFPSGPKNMITGAPETVPSSKTLQTMAKLSTPFLLRPSVVTDTPRAGKKKRMIY